MGFAEPPKDQKKSNELCVESLTTFADKFLKSTKFIGGDTLSIADFAVALLCHVCEGTASDTRHRDCPKNGLLRCMVVVVPGMLDSNLVRLETAAAKEEKREPYYDDKLKADFHVVRADGNVFSLHPSWTKPTFEAKVVLTIDGLLGARIGTCQQKKSGGDTEGQSNTTHMLHLLEWNILISY